VVPLMAIFTPGSGALPRAVVTKPDTKVFPGRPFGYAQTQHQACYR
jgi:hypothetical protein